MAKKTKLERHPQDDVKENLQEIPEDVKEFLQGETDELPEGAEEISNEEAEELEKQSKNADKCLYFDGKKINRECKKDDCKCYLLSSLDCDDFTEVSEEEKERVNSKEDAADPNDTSSNEEEKEEVKAEPVEEQKKYVNLKASLEKEITELQQKNIELEQKADEIEDMVSTFCLESLYGLENQIKYSIKNNTDKNDIKEVKNDIKNFLPSMLDGYYIEIKIFVYMKVPESFSTKKRDLALNGYLRPDKKPDWDNISKNICDALNGIAYADDKAIVDGSVHKLYAEVDYTNVVIRAFKYEM